MGDNRVVAGGMYLSVEEGFFPHPLAICFPLQGTIPFILVLRLLYFFVCTTLPYDCRALFYVLVATRLGNNLSGALKMTADCRKLCVQPQKKILRRLLLRAYAACGAAESFRNILRSTVPEVHILPPDRHPSPRTRKYLSSCVPMFVKGCS